MFFPDRRLIQFDCGKLQQLAALLRTLKAGGHKALIFTQMTKMLDLLEAFLNLYGYTYCRLDGATRAEQRQILMQRFNTDPKLFVFILSTRRRAHSRSLTDLSEATGDPRPWEGSCGPVPRPSLGAGGSASSAGDDKTAIHTHTFAPRCGAFAPRWGPFTR